MSIKQNSHFRYGSFRNSSLDTFDKVLLLQKIISSYTTPESFHSFSLVESDILFEFDTYCNLFLDMRNAHFNLKLQMKNV